MPRIGFALEVALALRIELGLEVVLVLVLGVVLEVVSVVAAVLVSVTGRRKRRVQRNSGKWTTGVVRRVIQGAPEPSMGLQQTPVDPRSNTTTPWLVRTWTLLAVLTLRSEP